MPYTPAPVVFYLPWGTYPILHILFVPSGVTCVTRLPPFKYNAGAKYDHGVHHQGEPYTRHCSV